MKDIVILGAGGLAREITFLLEECNKTSNHWNIVGYISVGADETLLRYPVLGDDDWLLRCDREINAVVSVANVHLRQSIVRKFEHKKNIEFPTIISKDAIVGKSSTIGRGSIICPGCIVTENANIGEFTIVNMATTIAHETRIGNYVTINPGVRISGNVRVDDCAEIGTNACLIQGVKVGRLATIGMGSVVINNVKDETTVFGNPTRKIK